MKRKSIAIAIGLALLGIIIAGIRITKANTLGTALPLVTRVLGVNEKTLDARALGTLDLDRLPPLTANLLNPVDGVDRLGNNVTVPSTVTVERLDADLLIDLS